MKKQQVQLEGHTHLCLLTPPRHPSPSPHVPRLSCYPEVSWDTTYHSIFSGGSNADLVL